MSLESLLTLAMFHEAYMKPVAGVSGVPHQVADIAGQHAALFSGWVYRIRTWDLVIISDVL